MELIVKELQRRINIVYGDDSFTVLLEDEIIKISVKTNTSGHEVEIRKSDYVSGSYEIMVNCFIPYEFIKDVLETIKEVEQCQN